MPDYHCDTMVSTRRLNHFEIKEEYIYAECGTSVKQLALACVEQGITGYEGLVDLPGTVASSLFGNAGCFRCSIAENLIDAQVLTDGGDIVTLSPEEFGFRLRSSAFKRGERKGIILSARLKCNRGDKEQVRRLAETNHNTRKATQPEPKNSLGSIFADAGKPTLLHKALTITTKPYQLLLRLCGCNLKEAERRRKKLIFKLLGGSDVEPYVRGWNWYQWSDHRSHALFWKYVRLHQRMFTRSEFEIIIKRNP